MFEKVSPAHTDKVADRIAGAMLDLAYSRERDPRVAVEVLIGHGEVNVMAESSVTFTPDDVEPIVERIAGQGLTTRLLLVPQDPHLAANQKDGVRTGDNGIFRGCAPTDEQRLLTALAHTLYLNFPTDGKYLIGDYTPSEWMTQPLTDEEKASISEAELQRFEESRTAIREAMQQTVKIFTICQSHAIDEQIIDMLNTTGILSKQSRVVKINPLGPWTGGTGVDCGATNRKLGSDMGDGVTGGGLHGKDLSKADVSVNIVCYLLAVETGQPVTACCAIGDESVTFRFGDPRLPFPENLPARPDLTLPYADVVERARLYIHILGGFERFAEWGLIRHRDL